VFVAKDCLRHNLLLCQLPLHFDVLLLIGVIRSFMPVEIVKEVSTMRRLTVELEK